VWIEAMTEPGDLVCDPFCGAGTFPLVCKMTSRRFVATEVDPKTAAVARKRLTSELPTGEKKESAA
jgi:DNA modification methylase